VTKFEVRAATEADLDAIAAVAIATDQVEEWSGSDPAYVTHLLAEGMVMVAESADGVIGFGATLRIGDGPGAVTMLCDLFVDPQVHGQGIGQALLAGLWEPGSPRMTFSSLHAHAVPVYTRAGLDAWWPLLYLGGNVRVLPRPDGWTVTTSAPALVAALEAEWTGIDRTADHRAWAARPGGQPVIARRGTQPLAAGTVSGLGPVPRRRGRRGGGRGPRRARRTQSSGRPGPGVPARAAPGHPAVARRGLARRFHGPVHGDQPGAARPAPGRPLLRPGLNQAECEFGFLEQQTHIHSRRAGVRQPGMMPQRIRFSPYCQSVPISANPAARSAAMCWLSSTDSDP